MKPFLALILTVALAPGLWASSDARPNILWITSEDNGPHLGSYGDSYARTPHLDELASRGLIYRNAWSTAPVCAPARTAIIMGMYPTTTGGHHMRSDVPIPSGLKMYPQLLREAGYYCTNNSKEDYNLQKPGEIWDESSNSAHWKNRKAGQPFFAIFNHTISHESQIRRRPHRLENDPAKVRIPAYHPDTPEVRHDWTQYYDNLMLMDAQAGANLRELEEAGLSEDTIVFYYADHGSGMPRSKRWLYNSGLQVPLIVYIPEKFLHLAPGEYSPGGQTDRLVGFVDLAPTLLSLAGIRPPDWMQGHAFMGTYEAEARRYLFGVRDRMDERIDLLRSVRDKRYLYIRNYMPHLVYGQFLEYMFQTPTTRIWKELYDQGRLSPPRTYFWESKPVEELYDLENDPDEVHNLAESSDHQSILLRFRQSLRDFILSTRDLGFLRESEMHRRAEGRTPYELGRDRFDYPLEEILNMADLASSRRAGVTGELRAGLMHEDSAVRYWAAMGLLMRGRAGLEAVHQDLLIALDDESPSVRVVAAEILASHGTDEDVRRALQNLILLSQQDRFGMYTAVEALNALDRTGERLVPLKEEIRRLPLEDSSLSPKINGYVRRLVEKILRDGEVAESKQIRATDSGRRKAL